MNFEETIEKAVVSSGASVLSLHNLQGMDQILLIFECQGKFGQINMFEQIKPHKLRFELFNYGDGKLLSTVRYRITRGVSDLEGVSFFIKDLIRKFKAEVGK